MGNKINIGKVKNSNIVGGNVSGNVVKGSNKVSESSDTLDNASKVLKVLGKSSTKFGLILLIIFVLALITLYILVKS